MIEKIKRKEFLDKFSQISFAITFVAYFLRTIFPFCKYIFIFSFLCSISLLVADRDGFKLRGVRTGFLYIVLFLIYIFSSVFSFNTFVGKEILNGAFILYFGFIFLNFPKYSKLPLIKYAVYVLMAVGIIAIIRLCFAYLGANLSMFSILFPDSSISISLVSDINFYSLYFILGLIINKSLFQINQISKFVYSVANIVFILNIVFSFSRRGLFILGLLFIYFLIQEVFINRNLKVFFKKMLIPVIAAISMIFVFYNSLVFNIYSNSNMNDKFTHLAYRINNAINPSENYLSFSERFWWIIRNDFWSKSSYKFQKDSTNLFYNGDLSYDDSFWGKLDNKKVDTIYFNLKNDSLGKFIDIERLSGKGNWSLIYTGRAIKYYAGNKYTLSFEAKIIKGKQLPFLVGWWAPNEPKNPFYLNPVISELEDGWQKMSYSYVFNYDQYNPYCLINSQDINSRFYIRNIRLECDGVINQHYIDELNLDYPFEMKKTEESDLVSARVLRYKYALELWQTEYKWNNKLFGHSFNYLERYGAKFYSDPKRYDYPHNPIISSFLYSGIIGGVFYIYFLIIVFWYYWKYRKHHMVFFIMYLVTFFFMMFSGNSHFSVPIFIFLSLIPFLTKYYVKSGKFKTISNVI